MTTDSRSQPWFALSGFSGPPPVDQRLPPLQGTRGESVSRRLWLLRSAGPSSVFRASMHVSLSNSPASSSHLIDTRGSLGPSRYPGGLPHLGFVTSARSLLPCQVTHSQVLRVGHGPLWPMPKRPLPEGWNPNPQYTKKEGWPPTPSTFSYLGGHAGRPTGPLGRQTLCPAR